LKKIVVSAGDPSGDLILAEVIKHLKIEYKDKEDIQFVGLCGPASEAQGVRVIARSSDVAVVGFFEVLGNLRKLFSILHKMGEEVKSADSLICVDFPDFNLRLAEIAYKLQKPVDYIVAPQVWVWRSSRLQQMRRLIRKLYPALPFEEELFRDAGVPANFLGHPIRDLLPPKNRKQARLDFEVSDDDFVLCWMPGSRKNELKVQFPMMIEALKEVFKFKARLPKTIAFEKWKVVLALAPGWTEEKLSRYLSSEQKEFYAQLKQEKILKVAQNSRPALMASDFAWITSGTATLEAALYQVPHILLYRLSRVSAMMISQMTSYFRNPEASAGLPNILLQKKVIPELLQNDLNPRRLAIETVELLGDCNRLSMIKRELRWLPKKLGDIGATERIAKDLALTWGHS